MSVAAFQVTGATVIKENVGQYGLNVLKATFTKDGESVEAEFMQKPETPIPADGEELTGEINDSQYGKKFRKINPAFANNGSAPSSGNRDAEINRAVAVKAATQLAAAQISAGVVKDDAMAIAALSSFTEQIFAVLTKPAEKPEGKAPAAKSNNDDIPF